MARRPLIALARAPRCSSWAASAAGPKPIARPAAAAALALACAGAVGCAPSAATLVAARQYPDAVCAATYGNEADRRFVAGAIERDLEMSVFVHAVTRSELEPVLGEATDATLGQALFLQVRPFQHASSLSQSTTEATLLVGGVPARRIGTSLETMASLTGEKLPEPKTVDPRNAFDKAREAAETVRMAAEPARQLLGGALHVLTLGAVSAPAPYQPSSSGPAPTTVWPTRDDFAAQAPRALALAEAKVEAWARPTSRNLRLRVRVVHAASARRGRCVLRIDKEIALPEGDSVEARINAVFGGRWLPLSEIAGGKVAIDTEPPR